MTGMELPDELPPSYCSHYGGTYLRDQETILLEPTMARRVRGRVETIVTEVSRVHNLT